MGWFQRGKPPEPKKVEEAKPWEEAADKALDAGDILGACERRLANDATLLALCNDFLGESEEPQVNCITITGTFVSSWPGREPTYDARRAETAVREERNRIRVRVAEANLKAAETALVSAREAAPKGQKIRK